MIPELLVPAGNLSKLRTALAYGADAVYVGAEGLSMRPDVSSMDIDTLAEAVAVTHDSGKRIYACINTMMFQEDMDVLREWLVHTREIPLDAVIVSDMGAVSMVRTMRPELRLHISTQMSTSNADAIRLWGELGAKRIVLARECTLEQVRKMSSGVDVELEIFVHGAMCVAVSGRCLLSSYLCGHSASRGQCKHSCRWEWQLVEKYRPGEAFPVFETDRETIILGSRDLCLIEHIPLLIGIGVTSLKVEGRMKSEYYVATVTKVYRAALDRYREDSGGYQTDPVWLNELEAISHRPYGTGFAFGMPDDSGSKQTENHSFSTHDMVAYVQEVCGNVFRLAVKNPFAVGEEVEWIGPGGGSGTVIIGEISDEKGKQLAKSHCGTEVLVKFDSESPLPDNAILRRRKK